MLHAKHLIYSSCSMLHLADLYRGLFPNNLTIVMYHGVADDDELECWWMVKQAMFEKQIEYIHQHFTIVSLDEALEALFIKRTKSKSLLVITFDDGYRNFLDLAFPILKSYGMPCTTYITTGPIMHNSLIWADQLFLAFKNSKKMKLDVSDLELGRWRLDTREAKRKTSHQLIDLLKTIPVEQKNSLQKEIIERLEQEHHSLPSPNNPFQLLSIDEIKKISHDSLVTIGSHTVNHEILTMLPLDHAVREIRESRDALEQWIGEPVNHFAYPNGNYNEAIINEMKKLGFKSAVITGFSTAHDNDPFKLGRVGIGAWDDMDLFKCTITGITSLRHKVRSLFSPWER